MASRMDSRDEANLKLIEEEHAEFDYKEMWEDGKVQEVQSDPQRLSDAIADANTLDYDVYTAALSELLETIHTDDLPTSAMALSVVIENIIDTMHMMSMSKSCAKKMQPTSFISNYWILTHELRRTGNIYVA